MATSALVPVLNDCFPMYFQVRVTKMHLFTIIQLVFLVVLLIIKSTQAALAFPFALILLIPVRLKVINRFFTEKELHEVSINLLHFINAGLSCVSYSGIRMTISYCWCPLST